MTVILPGGLGQLMAPVATLSAWNRNSATIYSGGTFALSNANRTATSTSTSGASSLLGYKSNNSGLHYFEITSTSAPSDNYSSAGFALSGFNGSTAVIVGNDANGWGMNTSGGPWRSLYNGVVVTNSTATPTSGDVFGFHVNFTSGYTYVSINGAYLNGDPSTGSSGSSFNPGAGVTLFPACTADDGVPVQQSWTLNTITPFAFTMFTGYSQWG